MRIIIVGQGGREHALAWRLVAEGHEIIGMPGNPGMAALGRCVAADLTDVRTIASACREVRPDLVVIGPEAPLAAGLADELLRIDIPTFGPTARAARIESSKGYAKDLMSRAGIPTARFLVVTTPSEVEGALAELGGEVAVKADGLAAGKGVVVCSSAAEARDAARNLLSRGPVVIEERLSGPELSVIAIASGQRALILPMARDHKRLLDGDQGPNTGGMGTVSPIHLSGDVLAGIRESVLAPVLQALADEGAPFVGAMFAGLMLTPSGPKVLEFNARFGDPETQSIVGALARNVMLGDLLHDAAMGRLSDGVAAGHGAACTVVMASKGYPDKAESGAAITGIDEAERAGAHVFQAGTRLADGRLVTAGGRVLGVMAQGPDVGEASQRALAAVRLIHFEGAQFRSDIGAG